MAAGSRGVTSTFMVGVPEPPFCEEEVVAMVPTYETTPGVVELSGMTMLTWSPTATSDCWEASRAIWT